MYQRKALGKWFDIFTRILPMQGFLEPNKEEFQFRWYENSVIDIKIASISLMCSTFFIENGLRRLGHCDFFKIELSKSVLIIIRKWHRSIPIIYGGV